MGTITTTRRSRQTKAGDEQAIGLPVSADRLAAAFSSEQLPGGLVEPTVRLVEHLQTTGREGRGAVAMAMAVLMGESGNLPVLYVEANFRRPALRNEMSAPGFCQVLRGEASLEEVARTVSSSLCIIPAGEDWPSNPGEFGESQVAAVVEQMKDRYSIVVLDAAPPLESPFSCRLARACEGVVLVAESLTRTDDLRDTVGILRSAGAEVLGVVINRCDSPGDS
jgi:polysaccharide biosynthesis transport protein